MAFHAADPAADATVPVDADKATKAVDAAGGSGLDKVGSDAQGGGPVVEAVSSGKQAGVPRKLWTFNLLIGMFGIGAALGLLGPTLTELADQLEVSIADAALCFLFRGFGNLCGVLFAGWALDKAVRNVAVIFCIPIVGSFLGCCTIPSLRLLPVACVLFWVQGMSMGVLDTAGNVLLLTLWRGSRYLHGLMHLLHALFGLGAFLAPLMVGAVVAFDQSAILAWYAIAVLLALSSVGFVQLCFMPQPKTVQDGEEGSSAAPGRSRVIILVSGLFLFCYVGMEVSFGGYIDSFAVHWLGAPKISAALLNSVYWGTLCAGRLVSAAISSHVHHARFLAVHLLMAVAGAAALLLCTLEPQGEEAVATTAWWWLGVVGPTALTGFAYAPLFPGAMLVTEELLEAPISGRAASFLVTSGALGEMFVPWATGSLFDIEATSFCWLFLALSCCASALYAANAARLVVSNSGSHKPAETPAPTA